MDNPRLHLLATAFAPVATEIAWLRSNIKSFIPTESQTTRAVLDHVFSGQGKLIRPALFYYCCKLLDYEGPYRDSIAAVCEFIHTSSLLHDDVIDNSSLRRNKPTASSIWGDEASVLVGDLIYSRASEMMAESGSLDLVNTFARAIRLMSEGELIQLENTFNLNIAEEIYLKIVHHKTAILIAACCRAAGILAGVSEENLESLSQFGTSVGVAFQLVDDALDFKTTKERFGKPTVNDLYEGKITLPMIRLRELASASEWQRVIELNEISYKGDNLEYIRELLQKYQTIDFTLERAKQYTDKAKEALKFLPDNNIKQMLLQLSDCLVWRDA